MTVVMRELTAGDRRTLDVLVGGATAGPTIVLHHGSPSDASSWSDWHDDAQGRGVRIGSVSRPGCATSTRQQGREVADAAADVAAVLDRCRAAATLAGVAPYGVPGLDFLEGMGPENVAEFGAALQSDWQSVPA